MKTIYFAHNLKTYGKEIEEKCYGIINHFFNSFVMVCPNRDLDYGININRYFDYVRERPDALIILTVNGAVSKGAFDEARIALARGIDTFCIDYRVSGANQSIHVFPFTAGRILNPDDWSGRYGGIEIPDVVKSEGVMKLKGNTKMGGLMVKVPIYVYENLGIFDEIRSYNAEMAQQ